MAQQGIVDTIKQNWKQFEDKLAGKKEEPKKQDYFAHNWTPPKGRKVEQKPAQKKVARKR